MAWEDEIAVTVVSCGQTNTNGEIVIGITCTATESATTNHENFFAMVRWM
jgi:hypothetical protein